MACLIVPESGLWAHLRHGPSFGVEEVGEDLFSMFWTFSAPAQYKYQQSIAEKLLYECRLAVFQVTHSSQLAVERPNTAALRWAVLCRAWDQSEFWS